ncbi:MAG TPA: hypothetical protein VLB50_12005 [Ignavibacteriaceae bacterium]|nr:hypothetical protein [Ignavibacteriaceae bacterium]
MLVNKSYHSLRITLFFILGLLFLIIPLEAQNRYLTETVTDTIPINLDNHYTLARVSVIPFTESITLRNKVLNRDDYTFSYATSSFTLSDTLAYSIFDTLFVTYQSYRLSFRKEYKKRSLVVKVDEAGKDTIQVVKSEGGGFTTEEIFGSNIEKSGTLVRGFTVGTTKDFTLNSGLRLQLSGKLSKDIEVVAALTDESTPIQPEGNTERLEELDKVFIQIKHPNAIGTFGDYQLVRKQGEFGVIDRKLQGLMGEVNYAGQSGYVSLATSRGKFNTNNFNGVDGVQGPYRLSGINNENDLVIIAGTEKVYLDGMEMKRGEANDYTIEYANAQITFTPKRLITSASRISVDFEYTDRRFTRNFFGTGVASSLINDKLEVQVQYLKEGDDPAAPIDISLTNSDKTILQNAGDNRNKAAKSGVSLAQPDSLGIIRGTYSKADTVINSDTLFYYIYNPGAASAIYNVSFSYVGDGLGDYSKIGLGNYQYVGKRQGGYLPVIFLPVPELKQIGNIVVDVNPLQDFHISLEYAGSSWDQNMLSTLDDGNNFGYARNILLRMDPKKIDVGAVDLGKIGFSVKDRFMQGKFSPAERIDEVEFNRNYNVTASSDTVDETLREIALNLLPVNNMIVNSNVGILKRGNDFKSTRYNNLFSFTDNSNYALIYNFDYVESKNLNLNSNWLRQKGTGYYVFWYLKPGVDFLAEKKKDYHGLSDSLLTTSLKYFEIDPFLEIVNIQGLKIGGKYSVRDDYFPIDGLMTKQARALTQYYNLTYNGIKEVSTTLNFTLRDKKYTEPFKKRGSLDNQTILIRSQSKFDLWNPVLNGDLFYEVSTERTAKLEKVFVHVQQGTGNYRYLGDLNNNGIADENEFEPAVYDADYILVTIPTDQLFPVINLKTSTRWKVKYGEIFEKGSVAQKLLEPFSTETFWRIEENSREVDYKKIYLLNFSAFQNEVTTIAGSNFVQQDIFLFENDANLSFRFRYAQTKGLNQFSGGTERSYNRERSLRITFRLIKEVSNQTDLVNTTDAVFAPVESNRKRNLNGNTVSSDFSYRPDNNVEVGFKIKVGQNTDSYPVVPTVIDLNSQSISLNLSFAGTGRLRIEIERDELTGNTSDNFLPFELTGGNLLGKNYYLRVNFDYRINTFLQSTVSYDGRLQGAGKAIHTGRAEVRAYF